jgi:hypothetical protein
MAHDGHFEITISRNIQDVPGEKVNILGGHINGHSKKKVYMNVSYFQQFPIFGAQYFEFRAQNFPSFPP